MPLPRVEDVFLKHEISSYMKIHQWLYSLIQPLSALKQISFTPRLIQKPCFTAGKQLPPKQLSSTQLQTNNCHHTQFPPKQLSPTQLSPHTFRLIQAHLSLFRLIWAHSVSFRAILGHFSLIWAHLCVVTIVWVTIVWVAIVSGGNCLSAIVWMIIVWVAIVFQP